MHREYPHRQGAAGQQVSRHADARGAMPRVVDGAAGDALNTTVLLRVPQRRRQACAPPVRQLVTNFSPPARPRMLITFRPSTLNP